MVCSAGGPDGSIRIWASSRPGGVEAPSAFSLQQLIQFEVKNVSCTAAAIAELPCGKTSTGSTRSVFAAAGYSDGTVRIFNVSKTKVVQKLVLASGSDEVTAVTIIALPVEKDNMLLGVICGTSCGHVVCARIRSESSVENVDAPGKISTKQNILVRGELVANDTNVRHSASSIVKMETCNSDQTRWLVCNSANYITVWHGEEVQHYVHAESVIQNALHTHAHIRRSSFGKSK